jgi:hypothetical protein
MQTATEIGANHTGMDISPTAEEMLENTELTEPRGDERELAKLRAEYGSEADPVGTLPQTEGSLALLMDKLGERLAFERSGARLYDALMVKCKTGGAKIAAQELQHIRDEEAMHFALCGAAIQSLGGDPTEQTPCADVAGVEGMGLMQVLTDPRTTVAQALHAILVAEMTDNAAWEELIELAQPIGNDDLVARFQKAQENEAHHLEKVRAWYKAATMEALD